MNDREVEKRGEEGGVGVKGVSRAAWWRVNYREVGKRGEKEGGVGVGGVSRAAW